MRLTPRTRIGPYEILAPIGVGGMGEVYRAHDSRLGRDVALKILRAHLAQDPRAIARFEREARAVAALSHPNILAIYDVGTHEGSGYVVTELLEGATLRDRLNRSTLPWEQAAEIGAGIAEGVAAAHARGLVHRDLKPENILLTSDGRVKILDFGLAAARLSAAGRSASLSTTITQEGTILGTVGYMSPEQVRGESTGASSDIFSLGCMLYEMRTGRRAFERDTAVQTLNAILESNPLPPESASGVPLEFDRLIARCLEKDPARRMHSAHDLSLALSELPRRTAPIGEGTRFAPGRRRLALLATAAFTLATVILLAIGPLKGWFGGTPETARIEALAVLPLENLSGDPNQDFFADGMTEALITDLGRMGSLRVIARPTVMRYKGTRASLKEIAQELDVQAILTGTVFRSEDRVRIAAQLVDPASDRTIWLDSYERDVRDVLSLQHEVTQAVALEVRAKLAAEHEESPGLGRRVHPEAYDSYLRARYLMWTVTSDEESQTVIDLLKHAIEIDPQFAPAHAVLGTAYIHRRTRVAPEEAKVLEQDAFAAVERALSLDPALADAYVARGDLLWTPSYRFAHERSVREYRHALELNPSLDTAHEGLTRVYAHLGFFREALRHSVQALDSNPINGNALHHRSETLLWMGRNAEALAVLTSIPRPLLPELVEANTAWAMWRMGNRVEARSRLRQSAFPRQSGAGVILNAVEAILLADVDSLESQRRIESTRRRVGLNPDHHVAHFVGVAWAKMGRAKEAVQSLRVAAESGFPCYPLLANDPDLDPIRDDPTFRNFLSEIRVQQDALRMALFAADDSTSGR